MRSPTVGGQRGRHRQGKWQGNRVSAYPRPHPVSLLLGPLALAEEDGMQRNPWERRILC